MLVTQPSKQSRIWGWAILALVALINYYRILHEAPTYELLRFIELPLTRGTYGSFWEWLLKDFVVNMRFIRPVPFLIQGLVVKNLPNYTVLLHLINVAVLVIGAGLVFLLLLKENVRWLLAWCGGLMFILYPMNGHSVTEAIGLGSLLGMMLFLGGLYIYAAFRDRPRGVITYIAEGVVIALMLLSYELYVLAPLLLLIYEFFLKAKGHVRQMRLDRLLPSIALWSALTFGYLALRYLVLHGIGGYDFIGFRLVRPLLSLGKWVSGLGALDIAGHPSGSLKVFAALPLILLALSLRKKSLYIALYALCWAVSGSLIFFFFPAFGHHIHLLSALGIILAINLLMESFSESGPRAGVSKVTVLSYAYLLILWLVGNQLIISERITEARTEVLPAQRLSQEIRDAGAGVTIYWAAEQWNRHIPPRLELLLKSDCIEFKYIPWHSGPESGQGSISQETGKYPKHIFARFDGRQVEFYRTWEDLIIALNP